MHACMHARTHIHTYTHTHTYIHACMNTIIHTYIHLEIGCLLGFDAGLALVNTASDTQSPEEDRENFEHTNKHLSPDGAIVSSFHGNLKDGAEEGDKYLFTASEFSLNETETESYEEIESEEENNWKGETDGKDQNEMKGKAEWKEANERRCESINKNETESGGEYVSEAKSESDGIVRFTGNQKTWKYSKLAPEKLDSLLKNSADLLGSSRFRSNSKSGSKLFLNSRKDSEGLSSRPARNKSNPLHMTVDTAPAAETFSKRRSGTRDGANPRKRSLRTGTTVSNHSCETLRCLRGGECLLSHDGSRSARCLCRMGTRGNRCQEG